MSYNCQDSSYKIREVARKINVIYHNYTFSIYSPACPYITLTTRKFDLYNYVNCVPCVLIYFRIRLPEDRDPRYDRSPLFGINAAPDGDGVGVIRQGDAVMVWC